MVSLVLRPLSHQLALVFDEYGQALRSAAVSYPRRADYGPLLDGSSDPKPLDEQTELHIVISDNLLINNDGEFADLYDGTPAEEVWHLGLPHISTTQELTGRRISMSDYSDTHLATIDNLLKDLDGDPGATGSDANAATAIDFEDTATGGTTRELRLLTEQRVKYFKEDVSLGAENFGVVAVRAIPFERYLLAITSGLFTDVYGSPATTYTIASLRSEGGYVELNADGHAWIPTGTQTLDDTAFFVPTTHTDPFGNDTTIVWDADALAVTSITDAKSNVTTAVIDYRTLSPKKVTDPNNTVSEVQTDELGRVTAAIVHNGSFGDSSLTDPTTKFTYDTTSLPNSVKLEAREVHGGTATYQESFAYLDGGGAVVQTKSRVAPGDAPKRDANGDLVFDGSGNLEWDNADPRWVGSGRVVLDNKGNVVKKYEPFFSSLSTFEDEVELVEWGVSPLFEYDPIGRNIKVTLPDSHSRRFVYGPWEVQAYDECDNETGGDHENTPGITHLDAIGRVVQTWGLLDDDWLSKRDDPNPANRIDPVGDAGVLRTQVVLDVSGNPLQVFDPRGIEAATPYSIQDQTHDLLGRALFTGAADEGYDGSSGDGENRVAPDIAGQPIRAWRSGSLSFEMVYDELRRPIKRLVTEGASTRLVEYREYGEETGAPTHARGRPWKIYDTAGRHEISKYDFKGNPTEEKKTVVNDMTATIDWVNVDDPSQATAVINSILTSTPTVYTLSRAFDALGRLTSETAPDGSVTTPSYDEGNRLNGLTVNIQGEATATTFVDSITYNARGQRLVAVQGDTTGVHTTTTYTYDDNRLWVTDIETQRSSDTTGNLLQDLSYTRDACGNITQITDGAHEPLYFNNTQVTATRTFTYDALYRLVEATGREKDALGQPGHQVSAHGTGFPWPTPGATVLETYTEEYTYDKAGNITKMKHIPSSSPTWTRDYDYETDSNQLKASTQIGGGSGNLNDKYYYNQRGAMVFMPHLYDDGNTPQPTDNITRDFRDHMRHVILDSSGNKAWYVYDAGGQRVGKYLEPTSTKTTLYLWGYEVYVDSSVTWTTLHVMDDQRRIALVENRTVGTGNGGPARRIRYQFTDHLGTAAIECDGNSGFALVSYEEFHPYGSSAWFTKNSALEVKKRYRYTGMERDDETGLQYHSQRYYAPWLGRWDRADPIGLGGGANRFRYSSNRPSSRLDPSGLDDEIWTIESAAFGEFTVVDDAYFDLLATELAPTNQPALKRSDFEILQKISTGHFDDVSAIDVSEKLRIVPESAKSGKSMQIEPSEIDVPGFEGRIVSDLNKIMSTPVGRKLVLDLVRSHQPLTVYPLNRNTAFYNRAPGTGTMGIGVPSTGVSADGRYTTMAYLIRHPRKGPLFVPAESDSVLFGELLHAKLAFEGKEQAGPDMPDPGESTIRAFAPGVDVKPIPRVEAQVHFGIGPDLADTDDLETVQLLMPVWGIDPNPAGQWTEMTENQYRAAQGYQPRISYAGKSR